MIDEIEERDMPANKYEMVIVAAREARRLNELARSAGQKTDKKVTAGAITRARSGEIRFAYEGEKDEQEHKLEKPRSKKRKSQG